MCSAITRQDPRVKIVEADSHTHARIGALKHLGGMSIDADFTVEFDHDDELSTDCLAEVATAFETGADFVYSRTGIAAYEKGFCLLDPRNGWRHERLPFHGSTSESLISPLNPPLYPQNLCRMALAPNHVRAWRTSAYRSLGGHSKELSVCDDLDLMGRFFTSRFSRFQEINRCIYKYRFHESNTFKQQSREIRRLSESLYDTYIMPVSLRYWSGSHRCVVLSDTTTEPDPGWIALCLEAEFAASSVLSFATGEVGLLVARDVLEYVSSLTSFLAECYRCLAHGGLLIIRDTCMPSLAEAGLLTQRRLLGFGPEVSNLPPFAFQQIRRRSLFYSAWHEEHNLPAEEVHLVAVKRGALLHDLQGATLLGERVAAAS
ncbi:MAG: hypothetical protein RL324_1393 [Verrucomicrobiota bacterium]